MRLHFVLFLFLSIALPASPVIAQDNAVFAQARENGRRFDQMATAIQRVLNFDKNYVRLNDFPEWYTVDENTLYRVRSSSGEEQIRLGSELIAGIALPPGNWIVEPVGRPPYGFSNEERRGN